MYISNKINNSINRVGPKSVEIEIFEADVEQNIIADRNDFFNQVYFNFAQTWVDNRMSGKINFTIFLTMILVIALIVLQYPSGILIIYCIAYPILFLYRCYHYYQTKSQLFLFDNCYFINLFLNIYLYVDLPFYTVFQSLFMAINGPVLLAILPFRNTLAFHDIDKMTSCFIHCMPPIVSWVVRWYPKHSSAIWFREFSTENATDISYYAWHGLSFHWFWSCILPLGFLVLHDVIYMTIVHIIIKPSEGYMDSFLYLRTRVSVGRRKIVEYRYCVQILLYFAITSSVYILGNIIAFICFNHWITHTVLISLQTLIIIWNGGCYYLDYFAYLALRVENKIEST